MRRRAWQRHLATGQVELNVIPLIDVVFFLLVFYVISTSFVQETALAIERPSSTQAVALEHAFVPVAILRSGAVQLGGEVLDLAQLSAGLPQALNAAGTTHVVVIADREASTGLLLEVMDRCTCRRRHRGRCRRHHRRPLMPASAGAIPRSALGAACGRRRRGVLFGLGFSVLVNVLLVILVVSLGRLHLVAEPQEVAVRHLMRVDPPPPPPAPPLRASAPPSAPQAVLPPLPPLALAEPTPAQLELPPPGPADLSLDALPASLPALVPELAGGPAAPAPPAVGFDQAPVLTTPIAIERFYPLAARNHGITGSSVVSLDIDAMGRITSCIVESSTPPGVFDQAVGELVASMRAQPARRLGVPVAAHIRRRIIWTLTR